MLIPEDSLLRLAPATFSRRQMLTLDGLRYAAEMSHIAYERLFAKLQSIANSVDTPTVRDIATAMLDAWSIVDSTHRFKSLLNNLRGLRNSDWRRLFNDRIADVEALRNSAQHQGESETMNSLLAGGQVWGYLSWAEVRDGCHTGKWLMMTGGADFVGDEWHFIGPIELQFAVPLGRVRLNAFNRQVYLGRIVEEMRKAVASLVSDIEDGSMRPIGQPATERRGADIVCEGWMEVVISANSST